MTTSHNIPGDALAAHTVLITTLDSLDDPTQRDVALKLVEESYARAKKRTLGEQVIHAAQAKILGQPIDGIRVSPDVRKTPDARVFEAFAQAWAAWAAGKDPSPFLKVPSSNEEEYGGAIHLMALEPWGDAIRELHSGSTDEARRLFRRSMEFGSQCGTETNNVVQWTYAATFFQEAHRGT